MGYGDEVMATGMARGAKALGKRVAFGDGKNHVWGPWSADVFRYNPNIAEPGKRYPEEIVWVPHYKGHRLYNSQGQGCWNWNYNFKARPGEFYFDQKELDKAAELAPEPFIVIEPHVPKHKSVAPNKDWGFERYQELATRLLLRLGDSGVHVCQLGDGTRPALVGARLIRTTSYRQAVTVLHRSLFYIGPEGGLHHAAAASSTNAHTGVIVRGHVAAAVIFGGFIPPEVTGYDMHDNFVGNSQKACGSLTQCQHCRVAMQSISVDSVYNVVKKRLGL